MSDVILQKIESFERWRDGNGHVGAVGQIADHEKRITYVENKCSCYQSKLNEIDIHRAKEKLLMQEAIEEVLHKRGKSFEGLLRAGGPYVAALSAIATAFFATR